MSGPHGAVPEGYRFRPPHVPTEVRCSRCGHEYQSYLIQWVPAGAGNGADAVHGIWQCPTPGCGGRGFGHEILPTDPEYVDEFGRNVPGAAPADPAMAGEGAWVEDDDEIDDGPSEVLDYRVGPFNEMDHDGWYARCVPEDLPALDHHIDPSRVSRVVWPMPSFTCPTDAMFEFFQHQPDGLINTAYMLDLADGLIPGREPGGPGFEDEHESDGPRGTGGHFDDAFRPEDDDDMAV